MTPDTLRSRIQSNLDDVIHHRVMTKMPMTYEQVVRALIDAVDALQVLEKKQGSTIFNVSNDYMDGACDAFSDVGRLSRDTLATITERLK